MAINGKKKIRNEACQHLSKNAMLSSCDKVIYPKVPFPPTEKDLDVPAQLIDKGYLFSGKVIPVGGNPIFFSVNTVS